MSGFRERALRVPSSASGQSTLYNVSVMTLAAHEDKTYGGGYIASPSMPWIWGSPKIENPSGAYHLVWSRDLYQIATALIAAGDTAGANRAVDYLFFKQQQADGSFPELDGQRQAALDEPAARRGRPSDRARLAAWPHRRRAVSRPH